MTNLKKAKCLKIWWWVLYSSILFVAVIWFVSSFVFWILGITGGLSESAIYIKNIISWLCWLLSLLSFIFMFVWLLLIVKAAKYDNIDVNKITFISSWDFDLQKEGSLRKFSWWGFWCPVLMLCFTKQYLWAVLVFIFDFFGLLPRFLVGAYARRRLAENRKFTGFEDYEKKARKWWILCSVIGILSGILMIAWSYVSVAKFLMENPYYLYMM